MKKVTRSLFTLVIFCGMISGLTCGKKSTSPPPPTPPPPPPPITISVPFTEGFEASIDSLKQLWYFWPYYPTNPGVGSQIFKPESGGASGKQCMAAGAYQGTNYVGYRGSVYGGSAILEIRKDMDLSSVSTCNLLFYNKRDVKNWISPPDAITMMENNGKCFVEISVNSGSTWSTLTSFSIGSVSSWKLEIVSLDDFAGLKTVRLRFRIPPHCVDGVSSPSTQWKIDDISVTGG